VRVGVCPPAGILTRVPPAPIVVVGAGLSGLACALDLARAGREVRLLEASPRAGGVVGTVEHAGFRFERGPNTVLASAAAFRALAADVGIADRLTASSPEARVRWLWFEGRLVALPSSPLGFAASPLLSARAKLHLLSEPFRRFRPPPDGAPEPTLGAFLENRLGPEPARVLAGAFVRGVYAAELDELGAASAFPKLWRLAADHGGLVRGALARRKQPKPALAGPPQRRGALLSFPRGLQELVDALAAALGPRLETGRAVRGLARADGGVRLALADGSELAASRVVLAVPAPAAARLLAPHGAAFGEIARVRHARVTLVHLGIEASELPRWRPGFGYLVPPDAGTASPRVLGTIFTSNLFPDRAPAGARAVSSFYSSATVEGLPDPELADLAARDLALALAAQRAPRVRTSRVERWEDVIPRYGPGHARLVERCERELERSLPEVALAGSWVAGVSVDQVIARGREVAAKLLAGQDAGAGRAAAPRVEARR